MYSFHPADDIDPALNPRDLSWKFIKLDSCAAVGASGDSSGFFGEFQNAPYRVCGVNKAQDSSFYIHGYQPFAMVLRDANSNQMFIACYGGMLKAASSDMGDEAILSTAQMSDYWLDTQTAKGARALLGVPRMDR